MSRAVVHKTKGKLDLRALTIFGLNAKPETTTPIGYFGTGLKYAVAVLARHNIPVTFWIDGKKWTVEQDDTKFRDKQFRALYLKRHTLVPKQIALPFTTELGKNWELWQAFRELKSNTRDEHGETHVINDRKYLESEGTVGTLYSGEKNQTKIIIEDERYVQCWLDRDKVFLPDGLTMRSSSDRIQAFARKSKHVYYRSIRIMDLKTPSENTYNILAQVDLTEDRTAKSEFMIRYEIEKFLVETKDREVIRRAITAPQASFERRLDYDYTTRSEVFLDVAEEAGEEATEHVKSVLRRDRPPAPESTYFESWYLELMDAINREDKVRIAELAIEHQSSLINLLQEAEESRVKDNPPPIAKETTNELDDDIPF